MPDPLAAFRCLGAFDIYAGDGDLIAGTSHWPKPEGKTSFC
jgi:hypothetical protein